MNDETIKLIKFWNTCDENFSHVKLGRHLPGYDKLCIAWEDNFCKYIDFENKSVNDYGIGGA